VVIETDRLLLRRPRPDDVDAVFAYRSRPDVARHLSAGTWSREKTERELAAYAAAAFGAPGQELVLLAETRDTGAIIGEVGLVWLDEARAAEIGYVFSPDAGGRGLATEAVRGLLTAAFDLWALDRVVAQTDATNRASRALCERLGMRLVSTQPSDDGRGVDECTYVAESAIIADV
jgi:RimJ/RimL family protein N-acetyltransferase